MLDQLTQFLAPPTFANEEQNRIAGTLNTILLMLITVASASIPLMFAFGNRQTAFTIFMTVFVMLICYLLMRQGRIKMAGVLMLSSMLLMVMFTLYVGEGVYDPAILILPIIIIIASLILDTQLFVSFTGLIVLAVGGIILLEVNGYVEKVIFTDDPKPLVFMIYAIILVITAVTVRLLTQNLKNNLARAQKAEAHWISWVKNTPDLIFYLQKDGTIDFLNILVDQPDMNILGRTIYDYSHPDFHNQIRNTIDLVLTTGNVASCETIGIGQAGDLNWYVNRFGPVQEGGSIKGLTMVATNITKRHDMEVERDRLIAELEAKNEELQQEILSHEQTENALRDSEEMARKFQQQLITLQEISIELTQIESFDELIYRAVELGISRLEFDRLGIWFLDEEDPNFMVGSFGTDTEGQVSDERHLRLPTTPSSVFDNDYPTDLKMKSWQYSVLYNGEHNPVGEGWNVIAPLWRSDRVIGFVSTDNLLQKRPFSNELLELLNLYASTLSHLIFRIQEEAKVQKRRDMLEKVTELGKNVTQVVDLRECLLRIYKSVREGLDFDRVGLFLCDEKKKVFTGTFGTDREGNIQEEWDKIVPADVISVTGKPLNTAERLLFAKDYKKVYGLMEDEVEEIMVGVGQHARVISWVGKRPVVIINADNLITGRRITEEQIEALHLFVGYAGLAVENARLLAQVRETEKQYRSIFENAIEGIFQMTPEGSFLSANPAMAHMLGYDFPEQLIADIQDMGHEVYTDPQQYLILSQALTKKGRVQNFEFEVKQRDGRFAWLSQNVHIVDDDQPLYFEGTVQDITARKEAEVERESLIQELELRNAELERFTYTVSHDLKSPLITIRGFLGFLEQDALSGNIDQLKTDILRITDATTRMQRLLDELLELSRVGRLMNPPEIVDFTTLVEDAIDMVSGRLWQNQIEVVVAPDLPLVFVDNHRIVEALQNLIDNAAKFMGGQPEPRIEIGMTLIDAKTVFFVRDNGIGIAPEYQDTVFGLFERLDQSIEGTGIGLALTKRIIEVHNGRLWVESVGNGKGSTFYFTLPLANEKNEAV